MPDFRPFVVNVGLLARRLFRCGNCAGSKNQHGLHSLQGREGNNPGASRKGEVIEMATKYPELKQELNQDQNMAFWIGLEYYDPADGWHLWDTVTIIGNVRLFETSPYFIEKVFEGLCSRFIAREPFIPHQQIRSVFGRGIKNQIDAPSPSA